MYSHFFIINVLKNYTLFFNSRNRTIARVKQLWGIFTGMARLRGAYGFLNSQLSYYVISVTVLYNLHFLTNYTILQIVLLNLINLSVLGLLGSTLDSRSLSLNLNIFLGLLVAKVCNVWSTFVGNSTNTTTNTTTLSNWVLSENSEFFTLVYVVELYNIQYVFLTTVIGYVALNFAYFYMKDDIYINRFILLLGGFLLSMLLLLLSSSFLTLILGWELIGVFSYLLINFWVIKFIAFKSAFKAFFVNKLSDVFLVFAGLFILKSGDMTYFLFENQSFLLHYSIRSEGWLMLTVVLLILCGFCKSAQFGFHIWLPDSMEAPVPASALIHSATLVSAGIFLVGKVNTLIYYFNSVWLCCLIWSSFTAFYGGLVAGFQTDLKKTLAYSTISHCGLIFTLLFYMDTYTALLYLQFHGWFKSLSFMSAGSFLINNNTYQDYRKNHNLFHSNTFDSVLFILSVSCLGSLPFTLGFFNKAFLLGIEFSTNSIKLSLIFIILASITGLFYVNSLVKGVLMNNYLSYHNSKKVKALRVFSVSWQYIFSILLFCCVISYAAVITNNPILYKYNEQDQLTFYQLLKQNNTIDFFYRNFYFLIVALLYKPFNFLTVPFLLLLLLC